MLYLMKRPSGGRGEYEVAGASDRLSASDLLNHEFVLNFGSRNRVKTGVVLRLHSGKLRLRIERGSMHLHRQLAAALLMPRPRREESELIAIADAAISDRNYVLRRVTFEAEPPNDSSVVITPREIETDSLSYIGSCAFVDRWSRVHNVIQHRETIGGSIAKRLKTLWDLIERSAPLTTEAETLVREIMSAAADKTPLYAGSSDVLPILEQMIYGGDTTEGLAQAPEIAEAERALASVAGRPIRGQGFRASAAQRRAVESHSMKLAIEHYTQEGWSRIDDVSARESYDLHCYGENGAELLVEVKGTTSDGSAVLLTPNEVALARNRAPDTSLFIVSHIVLRRDGHGTITASEGEIREIRPWLPEDELLTPTGFKYQLSVS